MGSTHFIRVLDVGFLQVQIADLVSCERGAYHGLLSRFRVSIGPNMKICSYEYLS